MQLYDILCMFRNLEAPNVEAPNMLPHLYMVGYTLLLNLFYFKTLVFKVLFAYYISAIQFVRSRKGEL